MTNPYPFQLEDTQKMAYALKGRALYAADMGLGKSFSALYTSQLLNSKLILVVCPASLKWVWEEQARQHFNLRSIVLSGQSTYKIPQTPVVIINYDILRFWKERLLDLNPEILICDEIHYAANRTAKRSKAVKKLAQGIRYVLGLSGTPILNRPIELWHPLSIINPTLFPNFWQFGIRYCGGKKMPWGAWDFSRATHTQELHKILLQNVMLRRTKAEVLTQLPPKQRIVIPLDIKNRKSYNSALSDFRGWLAKEAPAKLDKASRAEALVKLGYLKRLAAKGKMDSVYEWIDDFLSQTENKLILFAVHKKIIRRLMTRYEKVATKVDGSVTGNDRKLAIKKFLSSKKCRIFVGNIQAAGVGWSAKGVSDVAFVELPWQPGAVTQAEDRCHGLQRGVEGVHTCIRFLVAKDTVESRLAQIIQVKAKTISSVLDGSKTTGRVDIFSLLLKELRRDNLPTT